MGYTHYWNRPQIINQETFSIIGDDFRCLLPVLEARGVPLGNLYGREEAVITSDLIGFNGVAFCGHLPNPHIRLPWPIKTAQGIGDNAGLGGILPYRTCNGDCSYESFCFARSLQPGEFEGFCKTAFRPYDLAVTAFLVITKHHLQSAIEVTTDGELCQWEEAILLCQSKLGYGSAFSVRGGELRAFEEV